MLRTLLEPAAVFYDIKKRKKNEELHISAEQQAQSPLIKRNTAIAPADKIEK